MKLRENSMGIKKVSIVFYFIFMKSELRIKSIA